jgi:hypothetical protein
MAHVQRAIGIGQGVGDEQATTHGAYSGKDCALCHAHLPAPPVGGLPAGPRDGCGRRAACFAMRDGAFVDRMFRPVDIRFHAPNSVEST